MHKHRIMVIDIEEIVGEMAKISLELEGYVVETFLNGESALARMKTQIFDVVVTDYRMEDMDGVEVLRTVKRDFPGTAVIMMSAHSKLDSVNETLRGDVHDFLSKPFRVKNLKESIRRALNLPSSSYE